MKSTSVLSRSNITALIIVPCTLFFSSYRLVFILFMKEYVDRKDVAQLPEPNNLSGAGACGHGVGPESLAPVGVRDVNLDDRACDCSDSVANGVRVVTISCGVDDDALVITIDRRVKLVDNLTLGVRLKEMEINLREPPLECFVYLIKGHVTVDFFFSSPEEVQVRSVDDKNFHDEFSDN